MMTLLNNAVNSTCWSSDFAQSPVLTTSKERGEGEKVSDKGTMTEEEYKLFLCNNTVCLKPRWGTNAEAHESRYYSFCGGSSGIFGSKFLSKSLS